MSSKAPHLLREKERSPSFGNTAKMMKMLGMSPEEAQQKMKRKVSTSSNKLKRSNGEYRNHF
jgi:hypothetical protein